MPRDSREIPSFLRQILDQDLVDGIKTESTADDILLQDKLEQLGEAIRHRKKPRRTKAHIPAAKN